MTRFSFSRSTFSFASRIRYLCRRSPPSLRRESRLPINSDRLPLFSPSYLLKPPSVLSLFTRTVATAPVSWSFWENAIMQTKLPNKPLRFCNEEESP